MKVAKNIEHYIELSNVIVKSEIFESYVDKLWNDSLIFVYILQDKLSTVF